MNGLPGAAGAVGGPASSLIPPFRPEALGDWLRRSAGVLLIVAALLELGAVDIGGAFVRFGSRGSLWFLLIEVELFFGLWLALSGSQRLSRILAILCFAVLAVISAGQAGAGHTNCGCFGHAQVDPAITMGLDLGVVTLLLVLGPRYQFGSRRCGVLVRWVLLVSLTLACLTSFGFARYSLAFAPTGEDLHIASEALDLGRLTSTSQFRFPLPITNRSTKPIVREDFRVSCGCLGVSPKPLTVPAGGTYAVTVTLDLQKRLPRDSQGQSVPFVTRIAPRVRGQRKPFRGWVIRATIASTSSVGS